MLITPSLVIASASIFLVLASIADLRTGEIPEKISRAFVFTSLFFAFLLSLYSESPGYVIESLVVGAGFFIFGAVLFYLGEWGGGDVKILAGVGCTLGLLSSLGYFEGSNSVFPYYATYLINVAVVAAPYVIFYCFILGMLRPAVFNETFLKLKKKKSMLLVVSSFIPASTAFFMDYVKLSIIYSWIPVVVVISFYLKSVEQIALQKTIPVEELKEEDILAEDLVFEGEVISSRKDMEGLNAEALERIKSLATEGKIPGDIGIRWGVRFIPVFLFSFIVTVLVGDAIENLMRLLMS